MNQTHFPDPRWDKLIQLTCSIANFCTELNDPMPNKKDHRDVLKEAAHEIEKFHKELTELVHGKD